jgi:hypothetical protein
LTIELAGLTLTGSFAAIVGLSLFLLIKRKAWPKSAYKFARGERASTCYDCFDESPEICEVCRNANFHNDLSASIEALGGAKS